MSDSLNSGWGALQLPLTDIPDRDLAVLDPARDILLELVSAALNSELAAVWDLATIATGLAGTQPVQMKFPELPDLDAMRQVKAAYPLLAISRSSEPEREDEHTLWENRITAQWTVNYILGPLEVGNAIKLGDVLEAAGKIIAAVMRRGGHSAYATTVSIASTPPVVYPKRVLGPGPGCCGFSTVKVVSYVQGQAAFSENGPKYHALTLTMQSTELDSQPDEGVAYNGVSAKLGTGTGEVAEGDEDSDGLIDDLIEIDGAVHPEPDPE